MKLKERFIKLFPHQNEEYLDHEEAEMCEKIADDFAIEFINWLSFNDLFYSIQFGNNSTKELLEIFKKEKGL